MLALSLNRVYAEDLASRMYADLSKESWWSAFTKSS